MPDYKKRIFVRAITARMVTESRTAEGIIAEYTALTVYEKAEILAVIGA